MSNYADRFRTKLVPSGINPSGSLKIGEFLLEPLETPGVISKYRDEIVTGQRLGGPYVSGGYCEDELHKGPPWTSGGPFLSIKVDQPLSKVGAVGTYNSGPNHVFFYGPGNCRVHYHGGFMPPPTGWDIPHMLHDGTQVPDVGGWDLLAYKKCRPKVEKASGFIFGAESRDLPHMLKSTSRFFHDTWKMMSGSSSMAKTMAPKKVADDFLNHQFGWVPFIGDMAKFYSTFQNMAAIKSRLTNENGKWITRRAILANMNSGKVIYNQGNPGWQVAPAGQFAEQLMTQGSNVTCEESYQKQSYITGVGSFRYYRPEFNAELEDYNSNWSSIQRQLTIYGIRISPSNVYRATPWTWLADWFTDFGSVMDKITDMSIDALVAQYLYVQRHDLIRYSFIQNLPLFSGARSVEFAYSVDAKRRCPASTPYGFGLSWNFLSPRQLAILAALGITRWK